VAVDRPQSHIDQLPSWSMRVSLFVTCVVDLFEPDVGVSVVRVLRATGAEVDVPSGQTCCGQPAWNSGFASDAARVAAQSLLALDCALDADPEAWIVVPAGSCATMIRVFWPELFETTGDHERAATARKVGARTREFAEFIAEHSSQLPELNASGETVGYHHSCHMLRELRIDSAPTDLLATAGVTTAQWTADRRCCGFGGLFSFKLPETSVAMADDKLAALAETGCTELVGCDTSCLLHLRARSEHEGTPVNVRHLAQLIDAALPSGDFR
jgi:L-lactate dehydrogenase complex protein LldE